MKRTRRLQAPIAVLALLLPTAYVLPACTGNGPDGSVTTQGMGDRDAAPELNAPPLDTSGSFEAPPMLRPGEDSTDFLGLLGAKQVLAAGLAEADRTKRLVFLHSGASW